MIDYIEIGQSPVSECCAQVGDPDYHRKALIECRAFKKQLIRQFGIPPKGAELRVKGFEHDFGRYYEVVVYFNDIYEESIEYAFNIENNLPEYWDNEAKEEIKKVLPCLCSL